MRIDGESCRYGRLEFAFSSRIDCIRILRPDGQTDTVEAFVYQPIAVSYDSEGIEHVQNAGSAGFRCRYTPDFAGRAVVEAYAGSRMVEKAEITISDAGKHGYVEISKQDEKYFSYTDGTPFFSIGMNLAFPTSYGVASGAEFGLQKTYRSVYVGLRQYERWLRQLSENGGNVARIWVGHEYFNPDTEDIHTLNYGQFTKIDMLLALAKKYGVKLKLTLEQFRYFDYVKIANSNSYADDVFRKFNKRLYDGNRKCETMHEWLTDDVWIQAWLRKVSEFAKRYAGDTEIFAIELWNEMNAVGSGFDDTVAWNRRILPIVRSMFPKNLVINSLGSLDSDDHRKCYRDFCWEQSDFVQVHRYLDQGAAYPDCHGDPVKMIQGAFEIVDTKKPVFIAETGAVNNCHSGPFKFYVNDHDGILFADTVYTPVFCKSCGTGNIWHWDDRYVEFKNLYHLLQPIHDLTADIDFAGEGFEALDLSSEDVTLLLLKGKTVTLGYVRNKRYNWENVLRDLRDVPPVGEFSFELPGANRIQCSPVWAQDGTSAALEGETVHLTDIRIGTLFRIQTC